MGELVPQHCVQIGRTGRLKCRTAGRDDPAKADAQKTGHAGNLEGPDGEVVRLGEDLDGHRAVQLQTVLLTQLSAGPMQQVADPFAVDGRFARIHPDDEPLVFERGEPFQFVPQRDEVVHRHVVLVLLERLFDQVPTVCLLTESQQVARQLLLCRQKRGILFEGRSAGRRLLP